MLHHYELIPCLAVLLAGAQTKDVPMTKPSTTIKVNCKGNDRCLFDGQDLFLEIYITNQDSVAVGYPLAYRQKTGPSIRLIDTRTKADAYLKTNLADSDLREQFTQIPPGKSVTLEWVITGGEILQFGGPPVDLSAEVSLAAKIQVRGTLVDVTNTDTIHITSARFL